MNGGEKRRAKYSIETKEWYVSSIRISRSKNGTMDVVVAVVVVRFTHVTSTSCRMLPYVRTDEWMMNTHARVPNCGPILIWCLFVLCLIARFRADFRWCGIRIFDQLPHRGCSTAPCGCCSCGVHDGQTPFLMSRSCERRVGPGCSRTRQVSPGAGSPQTYQMVPGLCLSLTPRTERPLRFHIIIIFIIV